MIPAEFSDEVAQLKQELSRLQTELRAADAVGDRRKALDILTRMLELQSAFFKRWQMPPQRPEGGG